MSQEDAERTETPKISTDGGAYIKDSTFYISSGVNILGTHKGDIYYNVNPDRLTCPPSPSPPVKFGGRDTELQIIKKQLQGSNLIAITSLNGKGGIGKTTLARQIAYDLYNDPDSGFCAVLWCDITRTPDEGLLLADLALQVDPEFRRDEQDTIAQLARRVQVLLNIALEKCARPNAMRHLLVLDDVWENGLAIARKIQSIVPNNTAVLMTTRDETVAARLGVNTFDKYRLNHLNKLEGAKMLRQYLPDLPEDGLERLAEALNGYTMALKLAASRLSSEYNPSKALDSHIQHYQKQLPVGTGFDRLKLDQGQDKEDNLTKTLQYSYEILESHSKRQFRALGILVFDQPFNLVLLQDLWQLDGNMAQESTTRLWQLGLLDILETRSQDENIYALHPVLHSYALALLKENLAEYEAVRLSYIKTNITVASQFNILSPEEWGQLDIYLPHLTLIGNILTGELENNSPEENELALAQAFALQLVPYVELRLETKHEDWLMLGLKASQLMSDAEGESFFQMKRGIYHFSLGHNEQAAQLFQHALELTQNFEELMPRVNILTWLGQTMEMLDKAQAQEYSMQALNILLVTEDTLQSDFMPYSKDLTWAVAANYLVLDQPEKALNYISNHEGEVGTEKSLIISLNGLKARAYTALNELNKALEIVLEMLPGLEKIGDKNSQANVYSMLNMIYSKTGDYAKMLEYYEQAEQMAKLVGNQAVETFISSTLTKTYVSSKKRLSTYHRRVLFSDSWKKEALPFYNIATIYSGMDGHYLDQAMSYYKKTLDLLQAPEDAGFRATVLGEAGFFCKKRENWNTALDYLMQALALTTEATDSWSVFHLKKYIGEVFAEKNEYNQALDYYQQAHEGLQAIGDFTCEIETSTLTARALILTGSKSSGFSKAEQVLTLARHYDESDHYYRDLLAYTLFCVANLYQQAGETQMEKSNAIPYYLEAAQLYVQLENWVDAANMYDWLGDLYTDLNEHEKALDSYQQAYNYSKRSDDEKLQASFITKIANAHANLGNFEVALNEYQKASEAYSRLNEPKSRAFILYKMAQLIHMHGT